MVSTHHESDGNWQRLDWNVTAIGGYTRLLNDDADSPIVDDVGSADQFFVGIAVSYGSSIGESRSVGHTAGP